MKNRLFWRDVVDVFIMVEGLNGSVWQITTLFLVAKTVAGLKARVKWYVLLWGSILVLPISHTETIRQAFLLGELCDLDPCFVGSNPSLICGLGAGCRKIKRIFPGRKRPGTVAKIVIQKIMTKDSFNLQEIGTQHRSPIGPNHLCYRVHTFRKVVIGVGRPIQHD